MIEDKAGTSSSQRDMTEREKMISDEKDEEEEEEESTEKVEGRILRHFESQGNLSLVVNKPHEKPHNEKKRIAYIHTFPLLHE